VVGPPTSVQGWPWIGFSIIDPRQGDFTVECLGDIFEWAIDDHRLVVLDSLPAIVDIADSISAAGALMIDAAQRAKDTNSLLLIGNYAVDGPHGLCGVCAKHLNKCATTSVRVKHEHGRLGVSVPLCRWGLPVVDWAWTDALVIVGD